MATIIKLKVITSGAVIGNADLSNYYTKDEVDALIPKDYIIEIPDEYVTESELNSKGFINGYLLMSNYYSKLEVDSKIDELTTAIGNIDTILDNINGEVV